MDVCVTTVKHHPPVYQIKRMHPLLSQTAHAQQQWSQLEAIIRRQIERLARTEHHRYNRRHQKPVPPQQGFDIQRPPLLVAHHIHAAAFYLIVLEETAMLGCRHKPLLLSKSAGAEE